MLYQARRGLISGRGALDASSASAATTWNPSDKDSNIDLTGSNLIATRSAGYDDNRYAVKGTNGHSTGKYGFKVTVHSPNSAMIGVANSSVPNAFINGGGYSYFTDLNLFAWVSNAGNFAGATPSGPIDPYIDGDILTVCFDFDAKKFWGRVGSAAWNNDINGTGDPAAGTGAIALDSPSYVLLPGPYYPFATFFTGSAGFTADFSGTGLPSGFGAW